MRKRSHGGFTLAEMLAVIGIMLVLMVAAFGVFSTFAERLGPDTAVSSVQAMLNGARDYAATYGVTTQVMFSAMDPKEPSKQAEGTIMTLQYYDPGSSQTVYDVLGRSPLTLRNQTFVCKDMPSFSGVSVPTAGDKYNPSEGDVKRWDDYYAARLKAVKDWAVVDSGGKIQTDHRKFYVVFEPSGYLAQDPPATMGGSMITVGLTVIQLGGGSVTGFAIYPMNPNSGTRLVFEP